MKFMVMEWFDERVDWKPDGCFCEACLEGNRCENAREGWELRSGWVEADEADIQRFYFIQGAFAEGNMPVGEKARMKPPEARLEYDYGNARSFAKFLERRIERRNARLAIMEEMN